MENNDDKLKRLQLAKLEREVIVRKIFYGLCGGFLFLFLLAAAYTMIKG